MPGNRHTTCPFGRRDDRDASSRAVLDQSFAQREPLMPSEAKLPPSPRLGGRPAEAQRRKGRGEGQRPRRPRRRRTGGRPLFPRHGRQHAQRRAGRDQGRRRRGDERRGLPDLRARRRMPADIGRAYTRRVARAPGHGPRHRQHVRAESPAQSRRAAAEVDGARHRLHAGPHPRRSGRGGRRGAVFQGPRRGSSSWRNASGCGIGWRRWARWPRPWRTN